MRATPIVLRHDAPQTTVRARPSRIPARMLTFSAAMAEAMVIVLCAVILGAVYSSAVHGGEGSMQPYVYAGLLYAVLYAERMHARGFYGLDRLASRPLSVTETLKVWATGAALFATVAYLGKFGNEISRGFFACFFVATPVAVFVARSGIQRAARRAVDSKVVSLKRVLLVGEPGEVHNRTLLRQLRASGYGISNVVAVWFDADAEADPAERIIERARSEAIDEILICSSWSRLREINGILARLRVLPLPVLVIADRRVRDLLNNPVTQVGSVMAVELQRGPLSVGEQAAKRLLDLVLASIALAMLMPVMFVVGILIRLDSAGPVLFRQTRVGFSGRPFRIYKFRTMTVMDDGNVVRQATRGDRRITRIGAFLRRTSIDELPQLLNVIRGEMSLVGPRPHASAHDSEYTQLIARYAYRHHVKPGITGWAQVNGCRGETSTVDLMERRVECDLWYVNNWSLWLDLKTMIMTVVQVWKHDAY
jgi:putative colanic acid biosynthesis UDP-glucose lipid carrier transferase